MSDLCDLCGGELKPDKTTLQTWHEGELVIIRDLPADVCDQCGEAYFNAEVSEQLDQFLQQHSKFKPARVFSVPEYTAEQALNGAS